jgi:hypothetical protein
MNIWVQLLPAVIGLVGALIGARAALYGQALQRRHELTQRRQSLGFALAAEIEAYLDIVEQRGWVLLAENLFKQASNGSLPKIEGWLSEQEKVKDPFPIFAANMSNIGLLGQTTGPLAKFYTRITGVRSTVAGLQEGGYDNLGPSGVANVIRTEIDLWLETVALGRKIVNDLRSL